MASITCSTQHVAITSGSKVKVISYSDPSKVMLFDLKVKPDETDKKKSAEQKVKKSHEESAPGIDPHVSKGRVLAAVFSSSGAFFAACTDDKELTLWATQPGWTKIWTRTVVKRCMAVTFDHNETALYVADKTGDVYRFEIGEEKTEPTLILGHVSMLLDVVVSPDDNFIVTAERDEKIRVSHLPNAYNIHTFCLGHTEFISRLAILSSNLLISCAGDSTMRLWDYREGKEVCSTSYNWAKPPSQEPGHKNEATVTCISCLKEHNLIAVTILDHSTVPVYRVMEDEDGHRTFQEVTRVKCKHPPWSLTFDPSGRLLILVPDPEEPLVVMRVERNDGGAVQVVEDQSTEGSTRLLAQQVEKDWEFLKCSCNIQNVFKGLHKVPIDNMPDYLQRKQERMENTQSKKGQRRKARKLNKGKKRAIAEDVDNGDAPKRTLRDGDDDDDDEEEEGEEEAEEEEVDTERMEGIEAHS